MFRENNSGVSHAGWSDSFHDERALECRRWELACLAKASGVWAAARPSRDAMASLSVAGLTAQLAQCWRPALIGRPQPRQRFSARSATGSIGVDEMPFALRLCACVKCVGGKSVGSRLRVVDHNCCAPHSAKQLDGQPEWLALRQFLTARVDQNTMGFLKPFNGWDKDNHAITTSR
jgi:hypothetical protein